MNYILEILFTVFAVLLMSFMNKDEEEPQAEDDSVKITLEEMNGIYYAWEREKNMFLIQSKQVDEIIEHIKEKFPGKNFTIISNKEIEWLKNQMN